eukprot:TRINITY_DN13115_c0_g1_i1.p1 TRINITY_DN13115_c0_g1~~TRINITY_DN13115_c0_g1_i1.p1  ORF type:complete len:374 (-),score=70.51 TRINITY_DN13115_c0_g1_i1:203-1324(-)
MDVQFQVKLPFSGWDYFPLPNVASTSEQYELIINVQFPAFVAKFFGVDVSEKSLLPTRYEVPESPFVSEARRLIEASSFSLCSEGVGGTYFVRNADGSVMGIFKPTDEEPGALNNPKKTIKNPILSPGGGAVREVAAYLMDRQNFAGVPTTAMLSGVRNKLFFTDDEKEGSIQAFMTNDGESSSFGSSCFNTEDVHRIGTLDIRIFNLDRNGENILVNKKDGQFRLTPIDHTYCLPPISSLDGAYFEWQYWPQAKKPFSQQTKDYVASINIDEDAHLLRSLGLPEECVATMVVSTMLLKEAVAAGFTLYDIGCFMSRGIPLTNPSKFEQLIAQCVPSTNDEYSDLLTPAFLQNLTRALKVAFPSPTTQQQIQA